MQFSQVLAICFGFSQDTPFAHACTADIEHMFHRMALQSERLILEYCVRLSEPILLFKKLRQEFSRRSTVMLCLRAASHF